MVGSGMLMLVVVVAVVGEIEVYRTLLVCVANSSTYITMPANEGHSEFDACCRVDVALKYKHEENEAYLSERQLAKYTMKSKLLKCELLQLGGYLKLIEFGLDDCVDGTEA
uniref:Uncharacterized protein n=1 Tax=Tanacetum cinerariifolium TaxID=118510 RepID=A0A6L2LM57_TANCI|nr:hypothetical protein [Tanacetum cinerariifolium]